MDKIEAICYHLMFRLSQELFLIQPTAEVGFRQLCNHNQVAQQQQSNRSGFHYFIATTQNLSKMAASFCYINSRSTSHSLRPCGTNVSSLYCQKSSFVLVSCLLRPFSIKIISQSSIPQCPSNIKWTWNETWMTEWPLQNFLRQL